MSEQPSAAPSPARKSPSATARPGAMEPDLAAAWRELAAGARLSGALTEGADAPLTLFLEVGPVPPALDGRRLRLCFGEVSVMAVPLRAAQAPVEFGPVRLTLDEAQHFAGQPPQLVMQGAPALPPGRLEGPPLEAMSLTDERDFFQKVQNNLSRYPDPLVLRLGAHAGYRMPGFAPRAAALTVLGYRVLERDLRALTPADHAEIQWLRREGRAVVEEGLALVAAGQPTYHTVRWTSSLGTISALLALCQDDPEAAIFHFGAAAAQVPHVQVAPLMVLNIVQACLFQGVLLGLTGQREAARAPLELGLRAFQPGVAAQDVTANVWVIGDIVNAGRAARMCFIALDRFGMLEVRPWPRIHPGMRLELDNLASPLPRILAAGLCPGITAALDALNAAAAGAPAKA